MQETRPKHEHLSPLMPSHMAGSPRGTAIQLGLSHLIAGVVALSLSFWLAHLRIQQSYALLIAIAAASLCGLLCTLNLQYSLSLLELALSRLARGQPQGERDEGNGMDWFVHRWPLGPLFRSVHEVEQRLERCTINERLTAEVREKALQQAGEAAAQAERNRIARELHDSIKQQIFSISVSAAAARTLWHDGNSQDAREAVEDIQHSAKEAQVEMQALLQQLRPAPLENTSLIDALRVQAQALGLRTGAQMHVNIGALPGADRLLPGTQETVFRLVQEAFANIAKHARARAIWLALHTQGQILHIEVRDDGQGFDPAKVRQGMGLSNLRERTDEVHGSVEISSQPGQGTAVRMSIPLLEALRDPSEEAHQRYELARATEQARRGYQLCTNASFLGLATCVVGIMTFNHTWGLVALGGLLVALYGYVSGAYYRAKVALSAGRESRAALSLGLEQYHVGLSLARLFGLGALYALALVRLIDASVGAWLFITIVACLVGLLLFSRRRYARDTERYYTLLTSQELEWEVERRGQTLTRSLTIWCSTSAIGLIVARSLFVLPPQTPAQQRACGLAVLMLLIGIGFFSEYIQIRRWKQRIG